MSGRDEAGRLALTTSWERRLVLAARGGQAAAQARLLARYEPMVRGIVSDVYLVGGERDDLAQHARLGVAYAVRDWDPTRRVPFRTFAWLCAVREARVAYRAARARKHVPLNAAQRLQAPIAVRDDCGDGELLACDELVAVVRPDEDPVRKALGRERVRELRERLPRLSALERDALALSAGGRSHREIAAILGVGPRAVNNALQRARGKLLADRATA